MSWGLLGSSHVVLRHVHEMDPKKRHLFLNFFLIMFTHFTKTLVPAASPSNRIKVSTHPDTTKKYLDITLFSHTFEWV